jgi:hypothetical protein
VLIAFRFGRMRALTHGTSVALATSVDDLCYLSAGRVESPGGTLADLELCDRDNESVGTVDGVLIDAPGRRVKYFVVKFRPAADTFLLPVEDILHVDSDTHIARLETANADLRVTRFDPSAARPYSPDDAITAIFGPRAA